MFEHEPHRGVGEEDPLTMSVAGVFGEDVGDSLETREIDVFGCVVLKI